MKNIKINILVSSILSFILCLIFYNYIYYECIELSFISHAQHDIEYNLSYTISKKEILKEKNKYIVSVGAGRNKVIFRIKDDHIEKFRIYINNIHGFVTIDNIYISGKSKWKMEDEFTGMSGIDFVAYNKNMVILNSRKNNAYIEYNKNIDIDSKKRFDIFSACLIFFFSLLIFYKLFTFQMRNVSLHQLFKDKNIENNNKIKKTKQFDLSVHHFRGIVILFIVFLHVDFFPNVDTESVKIWRVSKEMLFHSSSALFAFISGYLAYYLEYKNFNEREKLFRNALKFYYKKIKNVYCPMIIISIFLTMIFFIFGIQPLWRYMVPPSTCEFYLRYIALGGASGVFWYIPFIMIMFIFTPYLIFKTNDNLFSNILIVSSLFFPLIISKSYEVWLYNGYEGLINLCRDIAYHGPHFIIGIYYAKHKQNADALIKKFFVPLCMMYLAFSILIVASLLDIIAIDNKLFDLHSLYHIQKLSLCFVIFHLLHKIKRLNTYLDILARYSFCIYFLHEYIFNNIIMRTYYYLTNGVKIESINLCICIYLLSCILSIATSIIIGKFIKILFNSKSRMIIGC